MSGWIKMRSNLHTDPRVVRISSALNADRLKTIGGLHAVWCLFDAHSEDGRLSGYTKEVLDSLVGWPGLADAMEAVGWLEVVDGESLALPDFDKHNGHSAKRRAQEADRKRAARESAKASASTADKKRTREEKRREDINTPVVPFEKIVALYHEILPELPQVQLITEKRKSSIRARWNTSERTRNLDWWREYFETCRRSPFLMGNNDRNWRADFDFLITESKFAKIVEGGYQGGKP